MKLTPQNIALWKKELNKQMFEKHKIKNFADTMYDAEWLAGNIGDTVEEAIALEESNWND